MTRPPGPDGIAVVDKPAGWTSHDVVAKVRGILRTRRVGHAGTLDPDATGVLVLGVGRATRLLRFVTGLAKTYEGEVVLGAETDTLDASGEVVARHDMAGVTPAQVEAAASRFRGTIQQVPPMVSAVRVGGRRLHELAREGQEVDRAPREVTIHEIHVEPTAEPGTYRLHVVCSSGTYVRSLAADLGAALGGGAHLRGLRRTAVGAFTLTEATGVEEVSLLPALEALRGHPVVVVDDELAGAVAHGRVLPVEVLGVHGSGPWPVVDGSGNLLAVYEPHERGAKPAVVLAS